MTRPPRVSFTATTGWEPDYQQVTRQHITCGYRGPFPVSESTAGVIAAGFASVFATDEIAEVTSALCTADRLLIQWGTQGVQSVLALRCMHADRLDGWLVVAHGSAPAQRGTGRLHALLRLATRHEPVDMVAVTEASEADRRTLRHLSPTHSVHPRTRASTTTETTWEGVASLVEKIDADGLCVADMTGVIGRRSRPTPPARPSDAIKRIAVTGTNGKTSCVELGRQLMIAAGKSAASFGTLGITTERGRKKGGRIGPGSSALPRLADRMWALGNDSLWFEAFSNALSKGLLDRLDVDVAIFTQLGVDHVSVHGSLAGYRVAKERLFTTVVRDDGTVVLDPTAHGADRVQSIAEGRGLRVITVGPGQHVELDIASLRVGDQRWDIVLPFTEDIMLRNLELVIGAALACGLEPAAVASAVGSLASPPGRFMTVAAGSSFRLVIEAGHNGDALQASLEHWRHHTTGRLLVLLASVGSSDAERWEPLGEVADVLGDVVVVTDESPYGENADEIRAALLRGCPRAEEIPDRAEAIAWIIEEAAAEDTVLLMGRADEDFVVVASGTVAYPSDEELVRQVLAR